jgi:hypothetical protein|tara:strand:- start:140 stop:385 length:246 start_codon:yes stop_codon:yes gene_type:complete
MSQNTHGKLLATVSLGYGTKFLLPVDDAVTIMKSLKTAEIMTGYGDTLAIEGFDFDSKISMELVSEVNVNKIRIKQTITGD